MNLTIKIALIAFFGLILQTAQAKKVGIFLHGFNGDKEAWTKESKIPKYWKDNIIDDTVVLEYKTSELESDATRERMVKRFIEDDILVNGRTPNDQYVLIGHSLGALVARRIYPALQEYINIEAVISVAGPSQGAMAATVNRTAVNKRIERMHDRFSAALNNTRGFIDLGVLFIDIMDHFYTGGWFEEFPNTQGKIHSIPAYLSDAQDEIDEYLKVKDKHNAEMLIGPDGEVIRTINSYDKNDFDEHPESYLSIFGVEKDKAVLRMAGQFRRNKNLKNEEKVLDLIQDLRDDYFQAHVNSYRKLKKRYEFFAYLFPGYDDEVESAKRRENIWKEARNEIDNIGTTWSEMINSYRFETEYIYVDEYIPCGDGALFGEKCGFQKVRKKITVKITDKHDGVVNRYSARWSGDDALNDRHNKYFDDTGADGGYNHFELRNAKRQYSYKPGSGGFLKGDDNPPMKYARNWLDARPGF